MTPLDLPARDAMHPEVLSVKEHDTLEDAHRLLRDKRVNAVAVLNGHRALSGVLSNTDLLRLGRVRSGAVGGDYPALLVFPDQRVGEVMTRDVVTIDVEATLADAARGMRDRRVHRVFVLEGGEPVGVVGVDELLAGFVAREEAAPMSAVMTSPVHSVPVWSPLVFATDLLEREKVSGLVVVNGQDWPVGTFTRREVLLARHRSGQATVGQVMSHAILCVPPSTSLASLAARALKTGVRRVHAHDGHAVTGVLTGLDFARVATAA